MAVLEHVFDGTTDNFQQLVIENSRRGAVLVNYWKPGAGPCFRLWQVLEALSREYAGRFLLVNVNTDTQKALARDNGVNSVPTVKVYRGGAVVESVYGAQSEASLRGVIDKYVAPAQSTDIARAIAAYQGGRVDEALDMLAEAAAEAPNDVRLHSTAIKMLLREARYSDIERYVAELSAPIQKESGIETMRIHARMLDLAGQAPAPEVLDSRLAEKPDDPEAGLQRAAVAMVQDDYAVALAHLLRVLRTDRDYADQLARRAMLVIFALLGDEHELTRSYQQQLRELLH